MEKHLPHRSGVLSLTPETDMKGAIQDHHCALWQANSSASRMHTRVHARTPIISKHFKMKDEVGIFYVRRRQNRLFYFSS